MGFQGAVFSLEGLVSTDGLLIKGFYLWRQKPLQAKFCPLLLGERGALVQCRSVEEIRATRNIQNIRLREWYCCSHFVCFPFFLSSERFGNDQRSRLTFARSISSSARPLRTALIMNRLKPFACS